MHLTSLWLSLIACLSAVIDTLAGGGGLLTVPALLLAGLNPVSALATNKLQASFGAGTASLHLIKQSKIPWSSLLWGITASFIGATLGTLSLHTLPTHALEHAIPILLLIVWCYFFFLPQLTRHTHHHITRTPYFFAGFGSLLGFYDGILGPGTGSFWVFVILFFLGWDLKRATIHTKVYNFTSNFASLLVFIVSGFINYRYGIGMCIGQIIGGYIGSQLILHKGTRLIRPVLLLMTGTMLILLSYQQWGSNG